MIFIDGSNMYHSLKAFFKRTDIDLGCFSKKLVERRRLVRIYYYNATVGKIEEPERFKDQQKFFNSVAAIPYMELRLGRLVYTSAWPNSPPYEKGVDVQLATDMLTHAFKNNYDSAILVAGDNDFVGALQAIKDNGNKMPDRKVVATNVRATVNFKTIIGPITFDANGDPVLASYYILKATSADPANWSKNELIFTTQAKSPLAAAAGATPAATASQ